MNLKVKIKEEEEETDIKEKNILTGRDLSNIYFSTIFLLKSN